MIIKFHQLIAKQQSTNNDKNFLLYNYKLQIDPKAMLGKPKSHNLFNATIETKRTPDIVSYSITNSLTLIYAPKT